MRVFISSIADELESFQTAAVDVVTELGHEPTLRDVTARRGLDPVTACRRQIARADLVVAIVGWRRGRVPPVALGGDGFKPWSRWEVESAFDHGIPVVALLASDEVVPERETSPEGNGIMADFRGELGRLGVVFNDEGSFRALLIDKLREVETVFRTQGTLATSLELRRFPSPELPAQPYPLLLPYEHPDLMAGRDEDLDTLHVLLDQPLTVIGLHAASGTGKSSLLTAGLVPKLRAMGHPVAIDRHPAEPGVEERLLADLVETGQRVFGAIDARSFVDQILTIRRLAADRPPVLVVDQFEELLAKDASLVRAKLGTLLAASAQRAPGLDDPPCRWLLAYRQEFHGRVVAWLEDVLRDARASGLAGIESLPHDLSGFGRFADAPLTLFGTPPAGDADPLEAATRVFRDAIEKPLRHERYRWHFDPDDAERLARAFAEARLARPTAPLVPELQVVLAHLLDRAGEPGAGRSGSHGSVRVEIPEEPAEMIDRALEEHLRRALDAAYPPDVQNQARTSRARALLVLRELADIHGQRQRGLDADALVDALGDEGREVLDTLSTARTRLVLLEQHGDQFVYVLANDRLAEVLIDTVDAGDWTGLTVDPELIGLRRFVALESQLFASGDHIQATAVPAHYFSMIDANRDVLLWTAEQRAWWQACRERRSKEKRFSTLRRLVAALVVLVTAVSAWGFADQRARETALLEEVEAGEPEAAFAALDQLADRIDADKLRARLDKREHRFEIFDRGLGGVADERRAEALIRVAELVAPLAESEPDNTRLIASLVWALDLHARPHEAYRDTAQTLRQRVLAPLRDLHPPPPTGPEWVTVPAGTFRMGADRHRTAPDVADEMPAHDVTLTSFRMLTREVTNADYRRLVPDHAGADELPAGFVSWYDAYTYAAWLGGRLPTEAEWEYATRASCQQAYCDASGRATELGTVAWWVGNSARPEDGESMLRPVMRLEPNPLGLWDSLGNVWEWTATWYHPYRDEARTDPVGPTASAVTHRVFRGGSAWRPRDSIAPSERGHLSPSTRSLSIGFRIVIPLSWSRPEPDDGRRD
ncbi:MAG: SUMF1/EgtB/PvdO family nonheme iron enzyme [Acidobacteriota bacterium]